MEPSPELKQRANDWVDMVPHIEQLMALASQVHSIVEFGVRSGVSTQALLEGLPEDGTMLSVDANPLIVGQVPQYIHDDPRWVLEIWDSRTVHLPEHADLVMIDSGHAYDLTVAELQRAAELTPSYIVCHDYLMRNFEWCMVHEAVDDFVVDGPYRIETVYESQWGLAVLVPK